MVTRAGRNTGVAVEEAASQQSSAEELDQAALAHKQLLQALVPYRPLAEVLNGEFKQEWYLQRTFSSTNDADLRNPTARGLLRPTHWHLRSRRAARWQSLLLFKRHNHE